MRILLLSQDYPPAGRGGMATFASTLAEGLAEIGQTVHVLCVGRGARPVGTHREGNITVHRAPLCTPRGAGRIPGARTTAGALAVAWSAWRAFASLQTEVDVVDAPIPRAEGLFFVRSALTPVVGYLHTMAFENERARGRRGLDVRGVERLERTVARRSALLASPRGYADRIAARWGLDTDRVRVVPNPVLVPGRVQRPESGARRVLFVGRLEPRKSPETVVAAIPRVVAEFPDASFVFIGADSSSRGVVSHRERLRDLARSLGAESSLAFVDEADRDTVDREIGRASVCVVPSSSESFGYAAAEASAAGRPVIATRALSEVVEDAVTGLLVQPGDASAFGEAIACLLREPGRAQAMGEAGRRLMIRRFNPASVATAMVAVYAEAREGFRTPAPARAVAAVREQS
jgi:glycogen synthase